MSIHRSNKNNKDCCCCCCCCCCCYITDCLISRVTSFRKQPQHPPFRSFNVWKCGRLVRALNREFLFQLFNTHNVFDVHETKLALNACLHRTQVWRDRTMIFPFQSQSHILYRVPRCSTYFFSFSSFPLNECKSTGPFRRSGTVILQEKIAIIARSMLEGSHRLLI